MSEPRPEAEPLFATLAARLLWLSLPPKPPGSALADRIRDVERKAAEQAVAAREAEIREALPAALHEQTVGCSDHEGDDDAVRDETHREQAAALLAAIGSPAAPRLDRERLARALAAHRGDVRPDGEDYESPEVDMDG